MSLVETLICAVLRGEKPKWPDLRDSELVDAFLTRSNYHGVQPLLNELLGGSSWPALLLQRLRHDSLDWAIWELRHQHVVTQTIASLAATGIRPVVFKGTALAYSLYRSPVLRTRGDTDLIVPREAGGQVGDALLAMGFARDVGVIGEFVSYQSRYTREEAGGQLHTLDLHWRINNSELLARLFTYEELSREAIAAPRLGSHTLLASPAHAMLLACMHRATHTHNPYYVNDVAHYGGDRLIWLYDIHLLAGSFTTAQWENFVRLADEKGLRAVCLDGMKRSRDCFHTCYPEAVLAALTHTGAEEPAAIYLGGGNLRQQWMDFCAIKGLRARCRFLLEVLFPPIAYMQIKYPKAAPGWLPWLYTRRAFGGVFKRLFRTTA